MAAGGPNIPRGSGVDLPVRLYDDHPGHRADQRPAQQSRPAVEGVGRVQQHEIPGPAVGDQPIRAVGHHHLGPVGEPAG